MHIPQEVTPLFANRMWKLDYTGSVQNTYQVTVVIEGNRSEYMPINTSMLVRQVFIPLEKNYKQ